MKIIIIFISSAKTKIAGIYSPWLSTLFLLLESQPEANISPCILFLSPLVSLWTQEAEEIWEPKHQQVTKEGLVSEERWGKYSTTWLGDCVTAAAPQEEGLVIVVRGWREVVGLLSVALSLATLSVTPLAPSKTAWPHSSHSSALLSLPLRQKDAATALWTTIGVGSLGDINLLFQLGTACSSMHIFSFPQGPAN